MELRQMAANSLRKYQRTCAGFGQQEVTDAEEYEPETHPGTKATLDQVQVPEGAERNARATESDVAKDAGAGAKTGGVAGEQPSGWPQGSKLYDCTALSVSPLQIPKANPDRALEAALAAANEPIDVDGGEEEAAASKAARDVVAASVPARLSPLTPTAPSATATQDPGMCLPRMYCACGFPVP